MTDKLSFKQWCELNGYLWIGQTTAAQFEARAIQYEAYLSTAAKKKT
jgi:hypothetical protein